MAACRTALYAFGAGPYIRLMVPPIEYDIGYWFRRRTLNPNPNPNPRTHPNPNPIFNHNRNKVFERKQNRTKTTPEYRST